jgi:hypothetical protein
MVFIICNVLSLVDIMYKHMDWGCSSVEYHLSSMYKDLGSILSTAKKDYELHIIISEDIISGKTEA